MSNKKIKNCAECQAEIQNSLKECNDWEVKRKKALKEIREKFCDANPRNNRGHLTVVQEKLGEYYNWPAGKTMSETWRCAKCKTGGMWATNGYGDFTVEGNTCQHEKPHSQHILDENNITIPHKNNNSNNNSREERKNSPDINQIKQYFLTNNIKSIKLEGDKLIFE